MSSSNAPPYDPNQTLTSEHAQRREVPAYPDPPGYYQSQSQPLVQGYEDGEESAGRRFLKAFAIAIFVCLLVELLYSSSFTAVHWTHWHPHHFSPRPQIGDVHKYDIPPGMALETCIQGDQWVPIFNDTSALPPIITKEGQQHMKNTQRLPYWSKASFQLPLSSESLSFISRGRASGILHITTSPDQEVDFATVNIWIIYEDAVLRNLTKACLVSRQAGDHGVGLFAPMAQGCRKNESIVSYQMMVIFPESFNESTPAIIKNLESDIPGSAHLLEDLSGKVHFDTISLKGSSAFVRAKSLTATRANIYTSHYGISGNFTASQELILEAAYSPIKVSAYLKSSGTSGSPSALKLSASGDIEADVYLLSDTSSGGSFNIEAETTSLSQLQLRFPTSPVNTDLKLKAKNVAGSTIVSLNPAYEGGFHMVSSSFRGEGPGPIIQNNSGAEDPTGQGRKRHILYEYSRDGKEVVGDIRWGEGKRGNSSVDVSSFSGGLLRLDL